MTRRPRCLLFQLLISCFGIVQGEYLGCYRDTKEGLMKGSQQILLMSLTPDVCVDTCTTKGFQYAGLKSRVKCLCDQRPPSQSFRSEELLCQSPCVGDSTKKCGGDEALSVYSTSLAQRGQMEDSLTRSFVGCYEDDNNNRLLTGFYKEITRNSPERCKTICHRKGFLYSGVEYRTECFCGDTHLPPSLLRDSSECSMTCPDDPTMKCGGSGHLAVYDTGITDVPELGKKLGCFEDESPRVLEGYKIDLEATNSPRRCMNLCRSLGYYYSGVEYGVECFCGNTVNTNISRDTGDEECNATCPGSLFDTCGGNWKLLVYRTGLSDSEPVTKKVACFSTYGSPPLKRYRQRFTKSSNDQQCAKLCYNKGFLYAALTSRTDCWCDNEKPSQLSVGGNECIETYTTVYQTGYIVSQPGNQEDYIGCFNDNRGVGLSGISQKFKSQLTPEKCSHLCFNKGYRYSGTKNKNECHCGNKQPQESLVIVSDEECSSVCFGDGSKYCGGSGKLSVYSTGISDISEMSKLIGCFKDDAWPRVLDGHKTDLEKTNSPRRCLNYCLKLGYLFAGVEYQKECFCGDSRPSATLDVPDSQCDSTCTGDISETCGGGWRMAVYRTRYGQIPIPPTPQPTTVHVPDLTVPVTSPKPHNKCEPSETMVNGKPACRGAVLFRDEFRGSSISHYWRHEIKIADAPDYEFVTFTADPANSFQRDGKLIIKPTLLRDQQVLNGSISLDGCTGLAGSRECSLTARSYLILPPVRSARIHTRKSFTFRYGVVEIRARLPAGDWLVPELWLLPRDQSYGSNYLSGKVRVAMSRGNQFLISDEKDISSSLLESGVLVGTDDRDVKTRSVTNQLVDRWSSLAHNYTLVWTPDNLSFFVDGQSQQALLPPGVALSELLGFSNNDFWKTGSRIAPFDTDFYLSLGVSAGGFRDFPDGCISKDKLKPWGNFKVKAMLNFWLDKTSWQPTWSDDRSSLIVEHVQVTAL